MKQREYPVYKGQVLEVDITGYTSEGQGVARVEGLAVFVAGAIKGERVKIRIAHLGHTAAYGDIVEILTASPERISPACPYAADCGGCVFWHMTYEEECRAKARRVADALTRIGGLDFPAVEITAAETVTGYRNKAQYPVGLVRGKAQAGFFRQRTHEVVPVKQCLIQGKEADQARETVVRWMQEHHVPVYDEKTHKGLVRHIYVRTARATGQVLVCLVINGESIPQEKQLVQNLLTGVENLHTVCLSIHKKPGNAVLGDRFVTLHGPGYIEDVLCGLRFRLSPRSFYQVNRDQAERLYEKAIEKAKLTGTETVLDLYCGTGTITLSLSRHAKQVIGVEIIPAAIVDAKENARRNGIENAEFFCADASQAAQKFAEEGIRPDVIVVDPPRKGIDQQVVDAMVKMAPRRIVYVSCDPATLARDLKRLEEQGYKTVEAEALDMFPRCHHVESVALLERQPDYLVLVNGAHRLPEGFADTVELITVENALGQPIKIEKQTYEAFLRLQAELRSSDGIEMGLSNSYRTVEKQTEIFERYTREFGIEYAKKYAARPGHSEHHTGLAFDVGVTVEGKYLHTIEEIFSVEHLYEAIQRKLPRFGLILRYPRGKEAVTGIGYEPWHFRYVGSPETAQEITDRGLCLEEYLPENEAALKQ